METIQGKTKKKKILSNSLNFLKKCEEGISLQWERNSMT